MKKVVVVDDDKDIRDMLTTALRADGWEVQTTDSLLGSLNVLSQTSDASCLLLDYNLPGMPMDEFLTQVRAICPKLGIVLLSAADKVVDKANKFGIPHYLGKPFDHQELKTVMTACLTE